MMSYFTLSSWFDLTSLFISNMIIYKIEGNPRYLENKNKFNSYLIEKPFVARKKGINNRDGFSLFHLGGCGQIMGGCNLFPDNAFARVNFSLTLGCSLGATLLTQFRTYYSSHYS